MHSNINIFKAILSLVIIILNVLKLCKKISNDLIANPELLNNKFVFVVKFIIPLGLYICFGLLLLLYVLIFL